MYILLIPLLLSFFMNMAALASDEAVINCKGQILSANGSNELILYRGANSKYYATYKEVGQSEAKIIASEMECSPSDSNYPFVFNCFGQDGSTLHGVQRVEMKNFSSNRNEIKVMEQELVEITQSYPSEFLFLTDTENCNSNR